MHTLAPDNSIISLKSLSGEENPGPKVLNVGREVEKEVEFWLVEPTRGPADYPIKKFSNGGVETCLRSIFVRHTGFQGQFE